MHFHSSCGPPNPAAVAGLRDHDRVCPALSGTQPSPWSRLLVIHMRLTARDTDKMHLALVANLPVIPATALTEGRSTPKLPVVVCLTLMI